jgi:hypothetical protein
MNSAGENINYINYFFFVNLINILIKLFISKYIISLN